jgi:hypothetical protein
MGFPPLESEGKKYFENIGMISMKLEQTSNDTLNNKKEVLYNEEGDILD